MCKTPRSRRTNYPPNDPAATRDHYRAGESRHRDKLTKGKSDLIAGITQTGIGDLEIPHERLSASVIIRDIYPQKTHALGLEPPRRRREHPRLLPAHRAPRAPEIHDHHVTVVRRQAELPPAHQRARHMGNPRRRRRTENSRPQAHRRHPRRSCRRAGAHQQRSDQGCHSTDSRPDPANAPGPCQSQQHRPSSRNRSRTIAMPRTTAHMRNLTRRRAGSQRRPSALQWNSLSGIQHSAQNGASARARMIQEWATTLITSGSRTTAPGHGLRVRRASGTRGPGPRRARPTAGPGCPAAVR